MKLGLWIAKSDTSDSKDSKFEYFKNWAITHLMKQEKEENSVCKSLLEYETELNKAFGVGTIRTWKGKKYIKGADKKWRPYYEHNSRGKEMAVAAIIRQINNLQDGDFKGLWNIIKNNKSRFVNEEGKPENEVIALYKMIKEKGAIGSGRLATKKNEQVKEKKGVPEKKLVDYIDIILNGTEKEKKELQQAFFDVAETPQYLKDVGLTGDHFTVRYGIISHHKNKDDDHNFSANEWKEICSKITKPFAVSTYGNDYSLFLDMKHNNKYIMVGVRVNSVAKNIEVNAITTAFAKKDIAKDVENIVYKDKKITAEQMALLGGPTPSISTVAVDSSIPQKDEKSRDNQKYIDILTSKGASFDNAKKTVEKIDKIIQSKEYIDIFSWLENKENKIARMMFEDISGQKIGKTKEDLRTALINYIGKEKLLENEYIKTMYDNEDAEKHIRKIFDDFPNIDKHSLLVQYFNLKEKEEKKAFRKLNYYEKELFFIGCRLFKEDIFNRFNNGLIKSLTNGGNTMKDTKLEYYKKKILEHLEKLQKQEKSEIRKSIKNIESQYLFENGCLFPIGAEIELNDYELKKAGYPVGTIREWKGKKYIKVAPGKWRPKYDNESRGAKLSIKALMKKVDACKDSQELLNLVMSNAMRFRDENGRPLDIVKELHNYVNSKNNELETSTKDRKIKQIKKENLSTYGKKRDDHIRNDMKLNSISIPYKEYTPEKTREILSDLQHKKTKILNKEKNIEAYIVANSKAKMTSESAINKSKENGFTEEEHLSAVAKIKELFENSNFVSEEPDRNSDISNEKLDIKRFAIEIEINGKKGFAVLTVQHINGNTSKKVEYDETKNKHNIYSVELKYLTKNNRGFKSSHSTDESEGKTQPRMKGQQLPKGTSSPNDSSIPQSDIKSIRKNYESSKSVTGNKKTITLPNGEKMKCHYKLVEANAPVASHNEETFSSTQGFPKTKDGKNINDRDYQNDKDAQESVRKIANNFNSLALYSPPIVTKDGIVISGNNRTMSSKLAAKNGTDKEYLTSLNEMIEEFGIDEEELENFKNPRIILEVDAEHEGDYTTQEFAQFNQDTKKTMNNVEKAVKLTKTLNANKIQSIAECLTDYDTMSDLYNDSKASQKFVYNLVQNGIIGDNEKAQFLTSDGMLNDTGKDFVETVLVGSVLNEDNIRKLDSAGGKRIRQKLVRAILPLIENKGTGKEYSFNDELNKAVNIAIEVTRNHDKFGNVKEYLSQQTLFDEGKIDSITERLAEIIHDDGEKVFAQRMKKLGAGLRESSSGVQDIFVGGVESKESLMKRFLEIKKALKNISYKGLLFIDKQGRFWLKKGGAV